MVSRSNSASQALYNLTASSPSASLYDDESQLLAETELDTLGDDGQSPAGVRRRKLTCWPLMAVLDALGLLALAGVAQTTDSSQPITPTAWLAATAVLVLVFGTFALLPMSKLAYHLHLHAFGFAYCMLIHTGLRVRVGSPAVHRLSDTIINWPFLVLVTLTLPLPLPLPSPSPSPPPSPAPSSSPAPSPSPARSPSPSPP